MSEQEQDNQPVESTTKVFFSKSLRIFPKGVVINAQRKDGENEEHVDVVVSNEDISDIYNAINGESPFDNNDK